MSCQNKLSWYELIPLFSYIGLGGRCRNCKTRISPQYICVEFITGFIFTALFLKFKDTLFLSTSVFAISYVYYAIIFSIFMVVVVYDIKHKIIPDMLSLILGGFTFIGLFFFGTSPDGSPVFYLHIPTVLQFFSGILISLPFALFWLISGGRWMGFGDAKLCLSIGWLLGVPLALSGLVIAFWSGSIVGVALIILSKNSKVGKFQMKSEIPFAPFLVFGTFLAFIFGLNLFGF